jgi:hypothetical protein
MGSVAPSDNMKFMDVNLIRKSCADDGKLLKPDMPAVRTDATILAQAGMSTMTEQRNQVWSTMSNLSGNIYTYLLAADSPAFDLGEQDLYTSSSSKETTTGYILWNLDAPFEPFTVPYHVPSSNKTNVHVYCIAPIFSNGWSFLGEAETKWTAVSQDRFSQLVVHDDSSSEEGFSVSMVGAPGEMIHLMLRTPKTKFIRVVCVLSPSGRATFHSAQMDCSETDTI